MSEEENGSSGNNVSATIDAVTGLVTAVPVYKDAVQPAAKELGKSLHTVARAVNVALLPLKGIVWSFEKIESLFIPKVEERLKDVPPEDIITPKPNVAGPAIEALRYVGDEESLSDMYANLLASAMDKKTAAIAHPAFVEIIKQLTPDEAKLMTMFLKPEPFPIASVRAEMTDHSGGVTLAYNLSLFGARANLEIEDLVPSYLDNLERLGLIDLKTESSYTGAGMYDELEQSEGMESWKVYVEKMPDRTFRIVRGRVQLTNLGAQFGGACVLGHNQQPDVIEVAG
jgi:hypothetical protein